MDLLTKVISIATTQIGVTEDPPGSNRGYSVEQYLKSVGLGSGYSWCASFLYWCFQKAATDLEIKNPAIKTGGVIDHWRRAPAKAKITAAQARKSPDLVKPGCIGILLLDAHTGAGHTFIVEKISGLRLTTIEGNSNNGGSREGIGVFRLDRRKLTDSILVGFLDYSRV
ncbi:CHAP domain-containing protein [Spirosoma flavum]|uniref:CHAP domain-containing protein n=1 Tax=Spirosoma flavum TaxID=2048557 RepID=A0ABW6ALV8_9BACT